MRTWAKNIPNKTWIRPVQGNVGNQPDDLADIDDDELVSRARRGEAAAFAALVKRHQAWATAEAARMVGPVLAPDAVQDALERICRAIDGYRPEGSFRAYLAKVLRRCCIDILRKRRETLRTDPADDELGADDPFLLALADRDLVAKAIASLDESTGR